jgi:hypothetical protein
MRLLQGVYVPKLIVPNSEVSFITDNSPKLSWTEQVQLEMKGVAELVKLD